MKRTTWVIGALLVAGAGIWWICRDSSDRGGESKGETAGATRAPGRPRPPRLGQPALGPGVKSGRESPYPPPVIERVRVDKLEVCRGEENFAEVEVSTRDGSDAHLHITVGTAGAGPRVPFRLEQTGAPRMPEVQVQGRGGMSATASLPQVKVKDCQVDRQLQVKTEPIDDRPDAVRLVARLLPERPPGSVVEPVRYQWDFGDGSGATTTTPFIEHSFENRPQDRRFSYFLVTVRATDRSGQEVKGSLALDFVNRAFGLLARHDRVLLFARRLGGTAGGTEQVRLWHAYGRTVRLTRVLLVEGEEGRPGESAHRQELDPSRLFPALEIQPGQRLDSRDLAWLRPSEPEGVRVLEVQGHSADGKQAVGKLSLAAAAMVAEAESSAQPELQETR